EDCAAAQTIGHCQSNLLARQQSELKLGFIRKKPARAKTPHLAPRQNRKTTVNQNTRCPARRALLPATNPPCALACKESLARHPPQKSSRNCRVTEILKTPLCI